MQSCRLIPLTVFTVILSLLLAAPHSCRAQAVPTYSVVDLGFPQNSSGSAWAFAVNNSGQIAGEYFSSSSNGTGNSDAFLWDDLKNMRVMGNLTGQEYFAEDINNAGQVVGITQDGAGSAFLWDPVHGVTFIPNPFGGSYQVAANINDYGQVVGNDTDTNNAHHAFLWDRAHGTIDLAQNPVIGVGSNAIGINASGQVSGRNNLGHPFLWTPTLPNGIAGTAVDLGVLPGDTAGEGESVNDAGQVTGWTTIPPSGARHAYLWDSASGMTSLGNLGGSITEPNRINSRGQIVGYGLISDNVTYHAFVWDSVNGMVDLNNKLDASGTGWTLQAAYGINDQGWIVGYGTYQGVQHAFLLQPSNVAQVSADHLNFQTANQSIWVPGTGSLSYDLPLVVNWDTGVHQLGGLFDVTVGGGSIFGIHLPSINLGMFGAEASVGTSGQAGLEFSAYANGGTATINYPVTLKMQFPDRKDVFAGGPVTITSNYTVDSGAALTTNSPSAGATLYGILQSPVAGKTSNQATIQAEAFSQSLLDYNFMNWLPDGGQYNIGKSNGKLYDTALNGTDETDFDIGGYGVVTGTVKVPQLNAAGGLDPNNPGALNARADDTFLTLQGNLTNLISDLIIYGPLEIDESVSLPFGNLDLTLSLIQLYYQATFDLQQTFEFTPPPPHIHLDLSASVTWTDPAGNSHSGTAIDFNAGQSVTFTMPGASGTTDPIIQMTPTFTLNDPKNPTNTFSNTTSVAIASTANFDPLEVSVAADAFGQDLKSFDVSFPFSTSPSTQNVTLWQHSFPMGGFPSFKTAAITLVGNLHQAPALSQATPSQVPMYIVNDNDAPATIQSDFNTFITGGATVVISGHNFEPNTSVSLSYYGTSVPLNTNYRNAATVQVQVPNYLLLVPGTARFTATAPNSTGPSNSLDFTIGYPAPILAKAGPNLWASDPDFNDSLISIVGSDFIDRSDYYWSPNSSVPSRWLQTLWNAANPIGTGKTMPAIFTSFPFFDTDPNGNPLTNPGAAPGPTVYWNSQPMTLYVEPAPSGLDPSLLPRSYFDRSQRAIVYLTNPGPGGGISNSINVLIGAPEPVLTTLQPATVQPASPGFRLAVHGASHIPTDPHDLSQPTAYGFEGNSVVTWNGTPLTTYFISATEVQADVPASLVATGALNQVSVQNPWVDINGNSGIHTSAALPFNVTNPVPVIASLHPSSAVTADPAFDPSANRTYNLSIKGSHFVPNSMVYWNNNLLQPTYVSANLLHVLVPNTYVASAGSNTITVVNPTPGGGTSNGATLNVANATPALASLSPSSAPVGSAALTLILAGPKTGGGFYSGSIVNFGSMQITPTFVSGYYLAAKIPATLLNTAGPVSVTVVNNPGGTSNALTFTVQPIGPKSVSFSPSSVVGRNSVTGTVKLTGPAPSGGITIALASSNSGVAKPVSSTMTVPAGKTSGTFSVSTSAVSSTTKVTISASANGLSANAALTVTP